MAGGRNVPGGHDRGRSARGRENDGFRAILEEDHVGIACGSLLFWAGLGIVANVLG